MNDKIRRIRCSTKKCAGFLDAKVSTISKSAEGNWQFQCAICHFWNLASSDGMVKATAREEFDLDQLPSDLRRPYQVTRESPGGV